MNKIVVVGIGAGSLDYLLPIARKKIEAARVLIGGKRSLETFAQKNSTTDQKIFTITGDLDATIEFIRREIAQNEVVVMVSGDPGFFSLLDLLRKNFDSKIFETIPGISSMQLAFAKLNLPWHDARLLSFHGRNLPNDLEPNQLLGILTDSKYNSKTIAQFLIERGWSNETRIAILSKLSYEDESIIETNLKISAESEPISHGILIVGY